MIDLSRLSDTDIEKTISDSLIGEGCGVFCLGQGFSSISVLRRSVQNTFLQKGIDTKIAKRLALVMDELISNAQHYGNTDGEFTIINIHIQKYLLQMSVSDSGKNTFSRDAKSMQSLIQKNRDTWHESVFLQRGRGYKLIESIVDSYEFEDNSRGGLTVKIEKKI